MNEFREWVHCQAERGLTAQQIAQASGVPLRIVQQNLSAERPAVQHRGPYHKPASALTRKGQNWVRAMDAACDQLESVSAAVDRGCEARAAQRARKAERLVVEAIEAYAEYLLAKDPSILEDDTA